MTKRTASKKIDELAKRISKKMPKEVKNIPSVEVIRKMRYASASS